jgi:hypothetical protein
VGVSLYGANDIDYVIDHTRLDGVQLRFSLLDPDPFLGALPGCGRAVWGCSSGRPSKGGF